MDIQQYANPFLVPSQQTPAYTTLQHQVFFFPLNLGAYLLGSNEKYLFTEGLTCKLSINTISSQVLEQVPKDAEHCTYQNRNLKILTKSFSQFGIKEHLEKGSFSKFP